MKKLSFLIGFIVVNLFAGSPKGIYQLQPVGALCIATNGSVFVAGGFYGSSFSTDGNNWENTNYVIRGVCYNEVDSQFIGFHIPGAFVKSKNGSTWANTASKPITGVFNSIAVHGDTCVAVSAGIFEHMALSVDKGNTWKAIKPPTGAWLYCVRWIDGIFIAVGKDGAIFTSSNGLKWANHSFKTKGSGLLGPGNRTFYGVAGSSKSEIVIVGDYGIILKGNEADGWNAVPILLPTDKPYYKQTAMTLVDIVHNNGHYVVVGECDDGMWQDVGLSFTSKTGVSDWQLGEFEGTTKDKRTIFPFSAIVFSPKHGKYIGIAAIASDYIATSIDGRSWILEK